MTSIIKFHALSKANILQVDEFRFLLDCGWDEIFDPAYLQDIQKYAGRVDAVLLTHADPLHLGALPYLVGKCELSCPVYATIPVFKMGQMFLYDYYLAKSTNEDFNLFNLDDVDSAFDKVVQLKYHQSINLKGKGYGITITPLPAGHMIGGTIWSIKIGEEDIYYAVDYNHKKERHLNGCELEKITKPSLFITDAFNANYSQARRRTRDEQLMTNILQTLKNGGNILIGVDTAGRVLELAHMLDQLWRNKESGLFAFSLAMVNNVAYHVIEFAKSQIEWMSDKLMKSFETARSNPFQFKHLQLCHSLAELNKIPSPKVVLASTSDLECGFSRDLFLQWCGDRKNSVILTDRSSPGTLGFTLLQKDFKPGTTIELDIKKRVKLEGRELDDFYRKQRESEYRIKKEKSLMEDSDSDDSDAEIKITGIFHGQQVSHDYFIKPGMENRVESGIFKSSKSKYPTFPFHEEKIKTDEYGEIIKQADFLSILEPNSDPNEVQMTKVGTNGDNDSASATKCIIEKQNIPVNCQVHYIDFEGRSDGESIQKIIEQMKPRRLIITRSAGLEKSIETLATMCKNSSPDTKVYTPACGEVINVTTESQIYQVKLNDSLVSKLEFKKGKDAELAWVDAHMLYENEMKENQDKNSKGVEVSTMVPVLEPIKPDEIEPHATVFVNELKLSDFKNYLTKRGIDAEFSGGVLWCSNGSVALRRQETGKLTVEGVLSQEYFLIRELLYDQYAIL